MSKLYMGVEMDLDVLVETLASNMNDRDLLRFVKNLENRVSSWEFSEALYVYFKELHSKYVAQNSAFD